jgi:hypothetical protein
MKEKIQLINHSSLFINLGDNVRVLSDPWYHGLAFDEGWSLLHENNEKFIENLLNNVDYIYISHEHPDHFSIPFFKKYSELLKMKNIKIIFQKTLDKRVENFLSKKFNLRLIILESYKTVKIKNQAITLVSCGAIDSSLIIETEDCYHINLNDCDFVNAELLRIKKTLTNKKKIIIYLQFSYAAYRSDEEWLRKAAEFKLKNLLNVYKIFNADLIIPFASFVYFSSSENFRLNKYMNNVENTSKFLDDNNINHCFLNPNLQELEVEKLIYDKSLRNKTIKNSIDFWDHKFGNIKPKNETNVIHKIPNEIKEEFISKIKKSNSIYLLFLIRFLSFKYFFGDIIIYLSDTKETYILNFFKIVKDNSIPQSKIDIQMLSGRLFFLIKNSYGIETLSSNGCLAEIKKNSFEKMIRSIGFVSLNQTNNGITIKSIFSKNIINKIFSIFIRLKSKNS